MHDRRAALAASIAASAICLGVARHLVGLRSCVSPEPVTAQVMKTSRLDCKRHRSSSAYRRRRHDLDWPDHSPACQRLLCTLRIPFDEKRTTFDLSCRARAAQGDVPGVLRLVDHVRGLGHRSAARRQPHLRRDAVRLDDWSRSTATAPVTTCGLPVAVSGAFDPSEKTDMLVVIGGFGTRYAGTPALTVRPAPRGARRARRRRRRGRHLAARPCRPARRPRGDHPLGRHGGFRRRLSRRRRAARPLRHRRAGLHHRRRLADLRPDAASGPLAPRHGGGARCRQRLHLRPGARRDRRAAAGLARPARGLRPAPCPGDPADGGAYRPAAHRRGDRPARRRHRHARWR